MRRRARLLPVVLAVAVLAASLVARFATTNAHADVLAVLQGSVGPGFVISLKNPDGSTVGHLDAGQYEIQVNDQDTNHNFHLEGPNVSMATGIVDLQTADWVVNLGDGGYTYHCDQHAGLTASFAVGTSAFTPAPAPTPIVIAPVSTPAPTVSTSPPATTSSSTVRRTVVPTVGGTIRAALSGTKVVLKLNGKAVTKVAAGTYKLVTVDSSKTAGFNLLQTGGLEQSLTLTTYTGTKTATVDLSAGKWKVTAGKAAASFTVK